MKLYDVVKNGEVVLSGVPEAVAWAYVKMHGGRVQLAGVVD